jgi:hypothetical protein
MGAVLDVFERKPVLFNAHRWKDKCNYLIIKIKEKTMLFGTSFAIFFTKNTFFEGILTNPDASFASCLSCVMPF